MQKAFKILNSYRVNPLKILPFDVRLQTKDIPAKRIFGYAMQCFLLHLSPKDRIAQENFLCLCLLVPCLWSLSSGLLMVSFSQIFIHEWLNESINNQIKVCLIQSFNSLLFLHTRQRCPLPATNKRFLRNVLVSTLEPRKKKPKHAGIIMTQDLCMTISPQNNFPKVAGHIDKLNKNVQCKFICIWSVS